MRIAALVFLAFVAGAAAPDGAVPVEEETNHKTVLKNDYVQVFRVTLPPGTSTGMHTHAHDDAAVRLSQATSTTDVPGQPETAPDTKAAGSVAARNNEPKPFTHRVHNVGATPYDVLDVQILKRPAGPAADAIRPPDAENPRMRVYRFELAPGAQSGPHTHARPYLLVAATPMNLRMTAPDGAAMAHAVKTGDLHWVEERVTHTLVNDGPETGVLVEFELK
jgi:quercetin dioxygenase-like cupin family protein